MPWLVRFTVDSGAEIPQSADLLDRHPVLVSALWDLGTGGVFEQRSTIVAGFDRLEAARQASRLAANHGMTADIESADDRWIRHESVEVTVSTASASFSFPVAAGAAFGHGGHPTTRLSLDLLGRALTGAPPSVDSNPPGRRVLDLGTGSGVLAIAAHHLGATHVTASDVDPAAIESARFNIAANDVDVEIIHGDIDEVADRADRSGNGFDVITANVLLVVHEHVGATAARLLNPGGRLVVAGVLDHQVDRAVEAYRNRKRSLGIIDRAVIDEWCGITLADRPVAR